MNKVFPVHEECVHAFHWSLKTIPVGSIFSPNAQRKIVVRPNEQESDATWASSWVVRFKHNEPNPSGRTVTGSGLQGDAWVTWLGGFRSPSLADHYGAKTVVCWEHTTSESDGLWEPKWMKAEVKMLREKQNETRQGKQKVQCKLRGAAASDVKR